MTVAAERSHLHGNITENAKPLTLTDALGRAVRNFSTPASPESTLDLRGLPAGLYLLRGAGPAQRLVVE